MREGDLVRVGALLRLLNEVTRHLKLHGIDTPLPPAR